MSASQPQPSVIPSFFRDVRFLQVIGQIIFAILVVVVVSRVMTDVFAALQKNNLTPNLAFLQNRAGFDISNSPSWYTSNSSYGTAFQVGLVNTLRVVSVGLVLSTLLGILVGVFLLSRNWLVRTISRVYVELLRNTPLLLQLFVWYFIVMLSLPVFREAYTFPPEGVSHIPVRLAVYALVIFLVWRRSVRWEEGSFRHHAVISGVAATLVMIEIGFWLFNNQPGWRSVYATGDASSSNFLLYAVISAALIVGAWFVPVQWRALALGSGIGQVIGGLLIYFGIIPNSAFRMEIYPVAYASIRGFAFPELLATAHFAEWMAFVGLGIVLAVAQWVYYGRITETTGKPIPRGWYALLAIVIFAIAGWVVVGSEPAPATIPVLQEDQTVYMPLEEARTRQLLTIQDELQYNPSPLIFRLPERTNFRFTVGTEIQPEYMALLLGLVVYTSAFIAEIVRAGIQAVPHGQLEAARAMGLTNSQTLRMIILPQALRVIIPPLGNQYLNLSKNSSLAIAIAYADLFLITTTIMNQSGQSVTGMVMVMLTYLIISLIIAAGSNWINRRFQLVTR